MVPFYQPEQGQELPTSGTAQGGECCMCGRRFTRMLYIVGRYQCHECTARDHQEAAKAGRI